MLEKKGIAVPATTDELADVLIGLNDPESGIYGLSFDGAGALEDDALSAAFTGLADWGE